MNESDQADHEEGQTNDLARLRALARAFGGRLAVCARRESTGESLCLEADRAMPTASVIKLAVLVTAFARDAEETAPFSLSDAVALRAEDRVGGSGILHELAPGTEVSLRDVATLMVVVSDNMATNLLIDALGGVEEVDRYVHGVLGLPAITLRRRLSFTDPDRGPLGLASPRALVDLLSGLLAGTIVSPRASDLMLDILARQQYLDQVPRLFERTVLAERPGEPGRIAFAGKTGMIDGVRADAGVIWLDGDPVTYAVMSEAPDGDGGLDLDADPQLVNAEVGRLIVERFWTGGDSAPLARHPAGRWAQLHAAAGGGAPSSA